MRIALAQIVSGPDPSANADLVARETAAAAAQGAEVVIFPEATMRCFGRSLSEVAEPVDGPWARRIRAVAQQHRVVVVAGMFSPADDGRVLNRLLITGPGVEAVYDKVHLYDAYGFAESATVAPGTRPVTVRVGGTVVGLATCYDVRFPALFTALAQAGAEIIVLPASWGAGPGKVEQWRLLLRARALDVTCFVVGVGQADPAIAGPAGDRSVAPAATTAPTGVGYSAAVGPDGGVLVELGAAPDLAVVDLDTTRLAEVRRVLPVLANRRRF